MVKVPVTVIECLVDRKSPDSVKLDSELILYLGKGPSILVEVSLPLEPPIIKLPFSTFLY